MGSQHIEKAADFIAFWSQEANLLQKHGRSLLFEALGSRFIGKTLGFIVFWSPGKHFFCKSAGFHYFWSYRKQTYWKSNGLHCFSKLWEAKSMVSIAFWSSRKQPHCKSIGFHWFSTFRRWSVRSSKSAPVAPGPEILDFHWNVNWELNGFGEVGQNSKIWTWPWRANIWKSIGFDCFLKLQEANVLKKVLFLLLFEALGSNNIEQVSVCIAFRSYGKQAHWKINGVHCFLKLEEANRLKKRRFSSIFQPFGDGPSDLQNLLLWLGGSKSLIFIEMLIGSWMVSERSAKT